MEKPFSAYLGNEEFVFVCYAHDDADLVYADLASLRDAGVRVWYDEGIRPGAEWTEVLADALERCTSVLYFVSSRSVDSQHCRREINYTLNREKPITAVFLEPTDLTGGLELSLGYRQALMRYDLSAETYLSSLLAALGAGGEKESPLPVRPRNRQKSRLPGLSAGLTLVVVVLGLLWWTLPRLDDSLDLQSGVQGPYANDLQVPPALAVLPFRKIGETRDYFADGLAEQLVNTLAGIRGLHVASRSGSFTYMDEVQANQVDTRAVGKALGVRYVLEGSVQQAAEVRRVTAQLVDAQSGYQLWSKTYDIESSDILAIQDDIAGSVSAEIADALGLEPAILQDSVTNSAIAFDYLLQAKQHMRSASPDAFELASPLAERAIQADPSYAEAHAVLCQISINRYEIRREVKFIAAAELQCGKAMALAPELWQIQYATGLLQTIKGEYAAAITTLEGILQASEGTADVTRSLAYAYELSGQPEQALGIYQQALLDEPGFWLNHNYLGWHHYEQGRYAEAVPAFERAVALAPGEAQPLHDLGTALHLAGDLEGAEIALRKSMELEATDLGAEHLGILYYYSGRLPEAREMFRLALALSPQNFRYWGRLCDLDLAERGTGTDLEACYKAVTLAEKEYAINPNRISTLTRLGFYLAATGMAEKSDRYMAEALALAPESPDVYFLVALAHGQLGREEAMFDALRKTIDKGGSRLMVADEPLLAHLRGDERFEVLLSD